MDRSEILACMATLKLYGMKAAFDQIITTAVKRQHEPQRVIGEFVASRAGLGYMILYASGNLDTPALYLGIIALAAFAAALSFAVDAIGPLLVHWRFADEK